MQIEYLARLSIKHLLKKLKGRLSRILQDEFPELIMRYWDMRFRRLDIVDSQQEILLKRWCKNTWSITGIYRMKMQETLSLSKEADYQSAVAAYGLSVHSR